MNVLGNAQFRSKQHVVENVNRYLIRWQSKGNYYTGSQLLSHPAAEDLLVSEVFFPTAKFELKVKARVRDLYVYTVLLFFTFKLLPNKFGQC